MNLSRPYIAAALSALCLVLVGTTVTNSSMQFSPNQWEHPDENLVLSWVSVVDSKGNSVPGLHRNDLHIREDDVEQKIEFFAPNSEPISVGIVSCGGIECTEAPLTFLKTTSWAEEYFVVVENASQSRGGNVLQSFTTDIQIYPRGRDGFPGLGGMWLALDYLKEAANHRKILLAIGTGYTESSSTPYKDAGISSEYLLKRAVMQWDTQIYAVAVSRFDRIQSLEKEDIENLKTYDPNHADNYIQALSRATGGRAYYSHRFALDLENACAEIARGLETQYLVGYRSTNTSTDGKWRRIQISVDPTASVPKPSAWARTGYYAPKEKKPATSE